MFKAMGKYVRAVFYLVTFRIDKASETLRTNPGVMSATYDRIIDEKRSRINQYKDAIAAMIAQEESKKQKLKQLTEEIEKLQKLKSGAPRRLAKSPNATTAMSKRPRPIPSIKSANPRSRISARRWLRKKLALTNWKATLKNWSKTSQATRSTFSRKCVTWRNLRKRNKMPSPPYYPRPKRSKSPTS